MYIFSIKDDISPTNLRQKIKSNIQRVYNKLHKLDKGLLDQINRVQCSIDLKVAKKCARYPFHYSSKVQFVIDIYSTK